MSNARGFALGVLATVAAEAGILYLLWVAGGVVAFAGP